MKAVRYAQDELGLVHVVFKLGTRTLGRDNNVIEDEVDATDCDVEVPSSWTEAAPPSTCLACLGNPWVAARRASWRHAY